MSEKGPIDSREWPRQLDARAVTVGPEPRLFGYDVEGDLARHYRFSDIVLLSLTGELPDEQRSRAFEVAMGFASAMSVAAAPIHGAVLARLCGARAGGVLSVAMEMLAEQASVAAEAFETPLPVGLRARDDAERASVARLAALLEGVLDVPLLSEDPSREVAVLAVLRACGLTSPFQLVSASALARLPSALAEANATKPGDFATYPIDTPHFEYVAAEDE